MTNFKLTEGQLTNPQKLGLHCFVDAEWRGAFPDVNPRTASALWKLGLLDRKREDGRHQYRLTGLGLELLRLLSVEVPHPNASLSKLVTKPGHKVHPAEQTTE